MAGQVIPIGFRAQDASGNAYSGALLYTYVPNTTTNKTTYTTDALSVAHANPVVADANGFFPQIWAADNATFDLVLKTAAGVTIDSWDDVTALAVSTSGAIERDFGAGGRLEISGTGGEVSLRAGPPVGDDVGGTLVLAGHDGTNLDTLRIRANAVAGNILISNVVSIGSTLTTWPLLVDSSADNTNSLFLNRHASLANPIQINQATRAANSAYSFLYCNSAGGADTEFNLRGDGTGLCDGSWTGGGADYAEYFEWADGNPAREDRRGVSVVLDGEKIRPAAEGDDPEDVFGVISGHPSVVGDAAWNKWSGKHLRDDFGSYVLDVHGDRQVSGEFDPEAEYVPRAERPEWDAVGLVGKLRLRKGQPVNPRWRKMRDVSATVEEWLVR